MADSTEAMDTSGDRRYYAFIGPPRSSNPIVIPPDCPAINVTYFFLPPEAPSESLFEWSFYDADGTLTSMPGQIPLICTIPEIVANDHEEARQIPIRNESPEKPTCDSVKVEFEEVLVEPAGESEVVIEYLPPTIQEPESFDDLMEKAKAEVASRSTRSTLRKGHFATKLFELAVDPQIEHINFSADGSRLIVNPQRLTPYLFQYFRTSKYASFQRSLNFYGFQKVRKRKGQDEKDEAIFHNPHFHRDNPQVAKNIKRKMSGAKEKSFDDPQQAGSSKQ